MCVVGRGIGGGLAYICNRYVQHRLCMQDVGQNALCIYVRRGLCMDGAACLNSGAFLETWLTLTATPTRIPGSATTLDGGSDNVGSGSLSPASAGLSN